jgi:hypothetical protein
MVCPRSAGPDRYVVLFRLPLQTPDNRFGTVGNREHAAVSFRFQPHAPRLKPTDGIGGTELGQQGRQFPFPAGIMGCQPGIIKTGVRHVAASAAGNPHLGQHFIAFFQ